MKLYIPLLLFLLLSIVNTSFAAEKSDNQNDGEAFVFYVENDSRSLGGPGSDQAYTNGLKFSYIYAENKIPNWVEGATRRLNILDGKTEDTKSNLGISLGHQIYTPNNIGETEFIPKDRPYAGWLYLGLAANFKEKSVAHFFELDLGMVGPSALGQEVQNNWHTMIGKYHAQGWRHGLKDEPTLQLSYQKRHKAYQTKNIDILPYYGAGIGNVLLGLHAGTLIRVGNYVLDDFGPSRPSSSDGDSFIAPMNPYQPKKPIYYAFFGFRGNLVGRSIFIDGNNFTPSHHVTRVPLVFDTELGVGAQILPFSVVWRFVTRSPEFEERKVFISFASINLIYFL